MALNITAAQYAVAKAYADAGNYQAGWNYLSLCGDKYADNAAAVTSGNATGIDKAFEVLVKNHWENTAGAEAMPRNLIRWLISISNNMFRPLMTTDLDVSQIHNKLNKAIELP
jgi:hypothetical protein